MNKIGITVYFIKDTETAYLNKDTRRGRGTSLLASIVQPTERLKYHVEQQVLN